MAEFVNVVRADEISDGGRYCTELDDRFVVIIRIGDQYFCLDDVCTHDGGPLGDGELTGFCLACPRHGAQFDIRTGEAVTMPATEPTIVHDVRIHEGNVHVRLRESATSGNL